MHLWVLEELGRGWSGGCVTHQCPQGESWGIWDTWASRLTSQYLGPGPSLLMGVTPPGSTISPAALNWVTFTGTDAQHGACRAQLPMSGAGTEPGAMTLPATHSVTSGALQKGAAFSLFPKWRPPTYAQSHDSSDVPK